MLSKARPFIYVAVVVSYEADRYITGRLHDALGKTLHAISKGCGKSAEAVRQTEKKHCATYGAAKTYGLYGSQRVPKNR